ncbi:hypothetical protein M409DRAFT_65118 [Zasmidium cellare ATCC 36951]|uniref:Zn(2)-C6 fungal-type domain-containing protein n=1 Tax=Zasmidium cellare ATCC 36951 TaxID=1080233 RepID=A0A6A6CQM7_ZASCE|nr:uncharacterized protein M409DRAFT_65118 [Zasmidium cellare ATCC 36951]KAF2169464.1 hypothetical protein M409DRAFT_65118 [Zasmidium cellare ATCC 36951]
MSTSVLGKRRRRTLKSCIPCHRRKRKCDRKYPCTMCTACEYNCMYESNNSNGIDTSEPKTDPPDIALNAVKPTRSPMPVKPIDSRIDSGSADRVSLDDHSTTYARSSTARIFPHILSRNLGSSDANNTASHSFAYNFGTRPEEASLNYGLLSDLISKEDLASYSSVYFAKLSAVGDFIDPRIYTQRCKDYYQDDVITTASTSFIFGAVAAGIAALGSFLSPTKHSCEADLVQYAKSILDDPPPSKLGVDIAYALRVFFLRATARPTKAWIASCTALHLCEAITWAGYTLLSYEYNRSPVFFRTVTTRDIIPATGSVADQFVRIAQIIPGPNSPLKLTSQPRTETEELFERLIALQKINLSDPLLLITRADLAFCFYRRAYQLRMGISDDFVQLVIDNGNVAVDAGAQLSKVAFFWNIIGSVFHYACILLAIDTPKASAQIPSAFKALQNLVMAADTKSTRDAFSMIQHLLDLHLERKRKEFAQLEPVHSSYQSIQAQPEQPDADAILNLPEFGYGIDWDQFLLEPYLPLLGSEVQI